MTVAEVLKSASIYLNLTELLRGYIENNLDSVSDEGKVEFSKILLAINNVGDILAKNIELKAKENILIEKNFLELSKLSKRCRKIKKITRINDKKDVKFDVYDNYITTHENGLMSIDYLYYPEKVEKLDDVINFGRVNDNAVVMGVCCEYCSICGLFDDASIWESKFLNGLKEDVSLPKGFVMASRKWEI